jgi:hypothetical protein
VLPAWATIVIALGGSAIGATAGVVGAYFALRGAMLNIRYEEHEAWRNRLIEAAKTFSGTWTEVGFLLIPVILQEAPQDLDELAQEKLEATSTRFFEAATVVALLFGDDSPAGRAAFEASESFADAVGEARNLARKDADARAKAGKWAGERIDASYNAHTTFLHAAHLTIRGDVGGGPN